jgi:peptidoglycan hydrolase FlgJ
MIEPLFPVPPQAAQPRRGAADDVALRQLAGELEASFLSEMLGHAGLGTVSDSFGGGVGEEQFASFLRQEQADAMVRTGGIGLAESLFRAMTEGRHDH